MGPTIFDSSHKKQKLDEKRHAHLLKDPDEYSSVMRESIPTINPFAAYVPKPEDFRFESQDELEKVLLVLRKHPLTQIPWMIIGALMLIAPSIILPFVPMYSVIPEIYRVVIMLGWYLLTFAFLLESVLSWIFNVYIITDERIIDTDFYSLIYKRISEAKIDKIEDVTSETGGVLRSLFDFGTITIQTAAEKREFEFEDVPHPSRVVRLLNELMLEEEQEQLDGRAR